MSISKNVQFSILATTVTAAIILSAHLRSTASTQDGVGVSENTPTALSADEYGTIKLELLELMDREGPNPALRLLRARVKNDGSLARSCHDLVHEIGRASYARYVSFAEAARYSDSICNSGYLHGVIEAHFVGSTNVFAELKRVCGEYSADSYLGWQCYHGIGHGLMYFSANDLPRSLEFCEALADVFTQSICENGVFMENFSADDLLHPSRFVDAGDPLTPCREQRENRRDVCYLYAPTYYLKLHENDYAGALRLCAKNSEHAHASSCARGVGSQAMKENVTHPLFIETVCASGDWSQRVPCISGAIGLFINHHGSLTESEALCPQLRRENRDVCYSAIQASASLFAPL